MTKQIFRITNSSGTTLVELVNTGQDSATSPLKIMEEVSGWDDYTGVTVNTVPKGIGYGSYFVSTDWAEREIGVTAHLVGTTTSPVRNYLNQYQSAMLSGAYYTLTRIIQTDTGVEQVKEVLTGIMKGVTWDQGNHQNTASAVLTFQVLNPVKTVYLNGSTTAETTGRL